MQVITTELFQQILIDPAVNKNVNRLQIVSGYVTAGMAIKHMGDLQKYLEERKPKDREMNIDVIVGMGKRDGINRAQHHALQRLVNENHVDINFTCRYSTAGYPVHAKTYCWLENGMPHDAFLGSANYTLTGFVQGQIESMTNADGMSIVKFYDEMKKNSIDCLADDDQINAYINFYDKENKAKQERSITISLLEKRTGKTPEKSGINWGHREARNPDQAYLSIPAKIYKGDFFPLRNQDFTVITDDGQTFLMVRAQDDGKALHTPQNNSIIGKYLRERMELKPGTYVKKEHLMKYGRTDITFSKIDNETYRLNFGVNKK